MLVIPNTARNVSQPLINIFFTRLNKVSFSISISGMMRYSNCSTTLIAQNIRRILEILSRFNSIFNILTTFTNKLFILKLLEQST